MKNIHHLLEHIQIERIDKNLYRGTSKSIGSPIVFGGQVIAQGLYAMSQEVEKERICHSIHGYFLLPGDLEKPIIFEVKNIRDGGSFSTRRVLAKQNDKIIFILIGSYQSPEEGIYHQTTMPDVEKPDSLISWDDIYQSMKGNLPKNLETFLSYERPIIFKPLKIDNPFEKHNLKPEQFVWFKIKGKMENDPTLNRAVLSYASDYNLLNTVIRAHGADLHDKKLQIASIDHSMWFHQNFDINQWFLYHVESPAAGKARGFTRAAIYGENGDLICSVTQEGLIRIKK